MEGGGIFFISTALCHLKHNRVLQTCQILYTVKPKRRKSIKHTMMKGSGFTFTAHRARERRREGGRKPGLLIPHQTLVVCECNQQVKPHFVPASNKSSTFSREAAVVKRGDFSAHCVPFTPLPLPDEKLRPPSSHYNSSSDIINVCTRSNPRYRC